MKSWMTTALAHGAIGALFLAAVPAEAQNGMQKWTQGKGWGWVWGKEDEVGSLNEMTDASRAARARLATQGKVYDLGVVYDRNSYKWPGHNPGEIISFRTPEGVKATAGLAGLINENAPTPPTRPGTVARLFMNDNVGTQIDGLGHVTDGEDDHWYNGFRGAEWGGNWACAKGRHDDPADYRAGRPDRPRRMQKCRCTSLQLRDHPRGPRRGAGEAEKLRAGRHPSSFARGRCVTGARRRDHEKIGEHDTAGIDLAAARWLVEQQGAILIGSDTSGLDHAPPANEVPNRAILV